MSSHSRRRHVQRNWPLTGHQLQIAAEFISEHLIGNRIQWAFDKGWPTAVSLEKLEGLPFPADKRGRRQHVRAIRSLGRKIVPANRQAAGPSRAVIHRAGLRYLRHCGGVEHFNISHFVRYIQSMPAARRLYSKSSTSLALSDHAIRAILKECLGIVGKPGRKKTR